MANAVSGFLDKGAGFFTGSFGNFGIILYVIIILICISPIFGALVWWLYTRKQWNLNVEFKIPRGIEELEIDEELDNQEIHGIVNGEWGKGSFNSKRGGVFLKRKGVPKIAMRPFDVKRYLQGDNILTVVQVGVEKYLPVIPGSYLNMVDDVSGQEAALLKTRIDTTEDRAWAAEFDEALGVYSIISLLKEYAQFIGMGLILAFNFIGFAILYGRMT